MLGMTPEPVLWPTWQAAVNKPRDVRAYLFECVGDRGTPVDCLARRAKPPSAGGQMVAYSPSTGEKLSLPAPASLSEAKTLFGSETPSEVSPEQSVHSDKVDWRFGARRVCRLRRLTRARFPHSGGRPLILFLDFQK